MADAFTNRYEEFLDGNYDYVGLGAYYKPGSEYGWYWVQVFASYDESPATNDWIVPGESL